MSRFMSFAGLKGWTPSVGLSNSYEGGLKKSWIITKNFTARNRSSVVGALHIT